MAEDEVPESDDLILDPDLPEDIAAKLRKQHTERHMRNEEARHTIASFFKSLSEEQLVGARMVLGNIFASGDPAAQATFYQGVVVAELDEYGHCMGCWEKHGEELKELLKGAR